MSEYEDDAFEERDVFRPMSETEKSTLKMPPLLLPDAKSDVRRMSKKETEVRKMEIQSARKRTVKVDAGYEVQTSRERRETSVRRLEELSVPKKPSGRKSTARCSSGRKSTISYRSSNAAGLTPFLQSQIIKKLQMENEQLQDQLEDAKALTERQRREATKRFEAKHLNAIQVKQIKDKKLQQLHEKLEYYRHANNDLTKQLNNMYNSEMYIQLENNIREKQMKIDELVQENKLLNTVQRSQQKRIDEQENLKDNLPSKLHTVMEELRISREKLRRHKEKEKHTMERSDKIHKQIIDMTKKNKVIADALKRAEQSNDGAVENYREKIEQQKEEISKLQKRIAALEKTKRAEKLNYDNLLKQSEDEIKTCKIELDRYERQFLVKEKEIREQVLELKQLKRKLKDLVTNLEDSENIQKFLQSSTQRLQNSRLIGHSEANTTSMQHDLNGLNIATAEHQPGTHVVTSLNAIPLRNSATVVDPKDMATRNRDGSLSPKRLPSMSPSKDIHMKNHILSEETSPKSRKTNTLHEIKSAIK